MGDLVPGYVEYDEAYSARISRLSSIFQRHRTRAHYLGCFSQPHAAEDTEQSISFIPGQNEFRSVPAAWHIAEDDAGVDVVRCANAPRP